MWKNLKAKTKRPSQADLDLGPGDEDGGGGSPRSPFGRGAMSTRKGTPLAGVLPADSDAWSVVTQAVGRLPLCGELSAAELEDLARGLELVEHRADEVILEAGAGSDDGLYIVWEGNAVAEKAGEVVVEYRSGDHFGELGLLGGKNGGRRNATVRATGGHSQAKHVTHCLRLAVGKFQLLSSVASTLSTVASHRAVEPTSPSPPTSPAVDAVDDRAVETTPTSPPPPPAASRPATGSPKPAHAGPVQCQWRGKGNFVQVWAELTNCGHLSFRQNRNQGMPMRTAEVADCTVAMLTSTRKGHCHAFRLDLAIADSKGDTKHVLSAGSALQAQEWIHSLVAHSIMDDITLTHILNAIESAEPEESNSQSNGQNGPRRVFTLSILQNELVRVSAS